MDIFKEIEKKILKTLIIFTVLPPTPVVIAIVAVSYILESYTALFNTLIILVPVIAFFTTLKIWLWRTTYLQPIKILRKHVEKLKSMGHQVDDSTYVVIPMGTPTVIVKSYDDIPRNHMYRVAAVEVGRRGYITFIGIANEDNKVYDLTKIRL